MFPWRSPPLFPSPVVPARSESGDATATADVTLRSLDFSVSWLPPFFDLRAVCFVDGWIAGSYQKVGPSRVRRMMSRTANGYLIFGQHSLRNDEK